MTYLFSNQYLERLYESDRFRMFVEEVVDNMVETKLPSKIKDVDFQGKCERFKKIKPND